jgi:membrane protease YdiL (CAAX protease family)
LERASTLPDGEAAPARRLAIGWRILTDLGLLAGLLVVGRYGLSFLPQDPLGWTTLVADTAAAVAAGCLVLTHLDRRPAAAFGFPLSQRAPGELGTGLLLGVVLNGVAGLLLLASSTARFVPDPGTAGEYLASLGWTLLYFGLAAAFEEAVFRGYLFQAVAEKLGWLRATLLLSALFAAAHANNPHVDVGAIVNIFLAGVLLSLAYVRTRSLWFATGVHAGWNWTMASLFGFPVSGLSMVDTPLYDARETGADWWTGGAFGPEAGLAGTLALLAGVLWLWRTRALAESERMREQHPLVDAAPGGVPM